MKKYKEQNLRNKAILFGIMLFALCFSAIATNTNESTYNVTAVFNSSVLIDNSSVYFSINSDNYTMPNIAYPAPFVRQHTILYSFVLPNYSQTYYIQNYSYVFVQNFTNIISINYTNITVWNNTCVTYVNYSLIPNLSITCPQVLINGSSNVSITIDNTNVMGKLDAFYNLTSRNDCPAVVEMLNQTVQPMIYDLSICKEEKKVYDADRKQWMDMYDKMARNATSLDENYQYQQKENMLLLILVAMIFLTVILSLFLWYKSNGGMT